MTHSHSQRFNFEFNIGIHVLLGLVCSFQPNLVILWVLYVILYEGTIKVYRTRNINGQAHFAAAYVAGLEMVVRMSKTGLPHELTKYAVIFILLNGLIIRPRYKAGAGIFLLFILLQFPSGIFLMFGEDLESVRQLISFNLSGPLCLVVACLYFYRRPLWKNDLTKLFQLLLLPIIATVVWLFVRTPGISELKFSYGANFAASGYGPNQMASLLGLGILLIGVSMFLKMRLFKTNLLAYVVLTLIAYRGLLTFSRGGMAGPLLVLVFLVIYFVLTNRDFRKQFGRTFFVVSLFALTSYGIYNYVNKQTGEALYNRYAGISYGKQVDARKYSSGRLDIIRIDTEIFLNNPFLGIGPGMGTNVRAEYGYYEGRVAAHIEFSRLLAEHGIFGLIALLILICLPVMEFLKRPSIESRMLLWTGTGFCLLFMLHSATRIAAPMFMYGLAFAYPMFKLNSK